MPQPYSSVPGSLFPTHHCLMGHCIAPDIGDALRWPPTTAEELLLVCRALVYKESGHFSHHCESTIRRLTPDLESAYRLGGEWAVQDLLGIMPNSFARRWI